MRIKNSLEKCIGSSRLNQQEVSAMAKRAWLEHGILVLNINDISNEWVRDVIAIEGNKKYGKQKESLFVKS